MGAIAEVDLSAPESRHAFADWASPAIPAMFRLIARLGPELDRDDILQDSLVRAWEKRDQFNPKIGQPTSWLLAITSDQIRQARRRQRRHPSLINDAALAELATEDTTHDLDLQRALARLTDRQHVAVDCYYFVGLSIDETAAVMKCAPGTVKSTLSDARRHLRRQLEGKPNND